MGQNIKNIIKKMLNEGVDDIKYFTTSRPMKIDDFIEIEVEDRGNYELEDVHNWMDKYDISFTDKIIWVALEPHIAARYQMNAEDWDNAKEIYDNNPEDFDVEVIDYNDGFIIPESNDGDEGFIFVFRR